MKIKYICIFLLTYLFATDVFALHLPGTHDVASLARGKGVFMEYCAGCHALKYAPNVHALKPSLEPEDSLHWFGQKPPDLSLSARVRGRSWLKAYLTGFYVDSHRPFGSNNVVFPFVAMPAALAPLQERMNSHDFERLVDDVVNFLDDVAEPTKNERYYIGYGVMIFMSILCALVFWS